MTPVTQRVEGWPFGECVRASYASILDLPIEAVPRFDPASLRPGETQRERERAWLASLGLGLLEVRAARVGDEIPDEVLDAVPQWTWHLVSGTSPRGLGHRCVGRGGRVAHDPHPSRAGLLTIYSVAFLVSPSAAADVALRTRRFDK